MKRLDRRLWFAGIALVAIVLLTLFAAPRGDRQVSGSTFSRAPDGYGAWYAYMQKQGTPIKQWKRPFEDFEKQVSQNQSPVTLLVIDPQMSHRVEDFGKRASQNQAPMVLSAADSQMGERAFVTARLDWILRGNTLVILGKFTPATEAPFSTIQAGNVKIETSRREKVNQGEEQLLGDRYGAIVWQRAIGKGRVILVNTPFLAANAYQDEPGNFAFLAKLVKQNSTTIWVDEYIHGYRESEAAAQKAKGDWLAYLTQTALLPVLVQAIVLLLVYIWADNHRLGQPVPLISPTTDNSEAYIQALSGVLHQAGRSEFVVDAIGKAEQIQIQQALGLGSTPLEHETLINLWVTQTGRPATELQQVLQPLAKKQRLSEQDLITWSKNIQSIHQHLP
ncbi:DUF4350 domain-containing protein [Phormidesmis priestleyi]